MRNSYIPINKNLIPYTFEIVLLEELFEIGVNYNNHADLFTLSLYKDGIEICSGEPIIYGKPLWEDVYIQGEYPMLTIIPLDESGETEKVTWDNLERTVFLFIDDSEIPLLDDTAEETDPFIEPRGTILAIDRVQEMQSLRDQVAELQEQLQELNEQALMMKSLKVLNTQLESTLDGTD